MTTGREALAAQYRLELELDRYFGALEGLDLEDVRYGPLRADHWTELVGAASVLADFRRTLEVAVLETNLRRDAS